MDNFKVVIILPVFNEAIGIKKQLENLNNMVEVEDIEYKIVVVEDGSTDGTFQTIKEISEYNENIVVLHHERNLGTGRAIYTGLKYSIKKVIKDNNGIIVTMESDNTSDLSLLSSMIYEVKKNKRGVVIASRLTKGGGYSGVPFIRLSFSVIGNILFKHLFRIKGVTDYTIFYKAYNASLIKKLFKKYKYPVTSKGFSVMLELLLKLNKFTVNVIELPFLYNYNLKNSKSKMSIIIAIIDYLKLFLKVPFWFVRGYCMF